MIDRKKNIRKTIAWPSVNVSKLQAQGTQRACESAHFLCLSVSLAKLYQTLIEDWGLLDVFTVES
jgi:hypothetical protein